MNKYPFASIVLMVVCFGLSAGPSFARETPSHVVSTGNDSYSITRTAKNGFTRDSAALKAAALDEAQKFCAAQGKVMKLISATEHRPKFYTESLASAKVEFKALDANDPELKVVPALAADGAPRAAAPTDDLYTELVKLDELRKRGILTDDEFQSEKKKVLNRSR